jgi:peptidyl-prolyl cis-trans isomerase C
VKEPLLWFVLIGGLLFTADHFRSPDAIVVNDAVRSQIAALWETQMGKQPSDDELESLVHDWVRQEVFYREALRLGLDRNDTIIRRRLVQKLGFLAREVDEESVTREDVQTFYQERIADYTRPVQYSLSQIYFNDTNQYEAVADLLHQRREQSLENYYEELLDQYEVDYQ